MSLCADCHLIDISALQVNSHTPFCLKRSMQELVDSAAKCSLCKLVHESFTGTSSVEKVHEERIEIRGKIPFGYDMLEGIYTSWYHETRSVKGTSGGSLSLFAAEDSPAALTAILGKSISAADDFKCARSWIETCCRSHSQCQDTSENFCPTRLVDVGGASTGYHARIISGLDAKEEYASLSHCWGLEPIIRSTKESVESFKDCIPWDRLSKTFKDAIQITRALNIRYLWIDSLCIIQDDYDDWEREAADMARVYAKACVNIAASGSSNGLGGCFLPRLPQVSLPFKDSHGNPAGSIVVSANLKLFRDTVREGPLGRRGWVQQERLLSRRRLYYAEDQLYWQCASAQLAESGYFENGVVSDWNSYREIQDNRDWERMVEGYSTCMLTEIDDKLPALSGLASVFAMKSGFHYAAGLWEEHLETSLQWRTDINKSRRAVKYRAPSWSWVSINGPVFFTASTPGPMGYDTRRLEIIAIETEPLGIDSFGKIRCSRLILVGKLKAVKCVFQDPYKRPENPKIFDGEKLIGESQLDQFQGIDGPVYCLQMARKYENSTIPRWHQNVLLLQPTGGWNEYRRIGMGHLLWAPESLDDDGSKPWFKTWFDDVGKADLSII